MPLQVDDHGIRQLPVSQQCGHAGRRPRRRGGGGGYGALPRDEWSWGAAGHVGRRCSWPGAAPGRKNVAVLAAATTDPELVPRPDPPGGEYSPASLNSVRSHVAGIARCAEPSHTFFNFQYTLQHTCLTSYSTQHSSSFTTSYSRSGFVVLVTLSRTVYLANQITISTAGQMGIACKVPAILLSICM